MWVKTVVKQKRQIRWDEKEGKKELLKEIATRRCRVECSGDVNEIEVLDTYCEIYKMFQNHSSFNYIDIIVELLLFSFTKF